MVEKKRKERVKKTMARVVGKPSMMEEVKKKRLLLQLPKLRSLWVMPSGQGLLHQSPKKHPRLLPSPRLHLIGIPGTSQLLKRTRPQCLKLLQKKKMKSMF